MFQSFFIGGFECSTHKLLSGKRLDVTAATCHDKFAAADYQRLQQQGIYTVREGICWHLIEQSPEKYDFSSAGPIIRAARDTKMQVIGDLYPGWDDDRHCYNGLWDYCNESGDREIYQPLADELQFQRQQIEPLLKLKN